MIGDGRCHGLYGSIQALTSLTSLPHASSTQMNVFGIFLSCCPYLLMALASVSRLNIRAEAFGVNSPLANEFVIFFMGSFAIGLLTILTVALRERWLGLANNKPWRIFRWALTLGLIAFFFVFLLGIKTLYTGNGATSIIIILYANLHLIIAFHRFATAAFSQNNAVRAFVSYTLVCTFDGQPMDGIFRPSLNYRIQLTLIMMQVDTGFFAVDSLIGYTMFVIIALLAFLGVPAILQVRWDSQQGHEGVSFQNIWASQSRCYDSSVAAAHSHSCFPSTGQYRCDHQMRLLFNDSFAKMASYGKIARAMKDAKVCKAWEIFGIITIITEHKACRHLFLPFTWTLQ